MLHLGAGIEAMQPAFYERCVVCGPVPAEIVCDAEDLDRQRVRREAFRSARSARARPRGRELGAGNEMAAALVACTRCGLLFHAPSLEGREFLPKEPMAAEPSALRPMLRTLLRMDPGARQALTIARSPSGGFDMTVERNLEGLARAGASAGWDREASVAKRTLEDLACEEASVDAVLVWHGFENLADPRRMLHAAAQRLRPGGWFAARFPHGGCFRALATLLKEPLAQGADFAELCLGWNHLLGFPYHHGYSLQSLDALAAEAGFARRAAFGSTAGPLAEVRDPLWARAEERAVKRAQREWIRLEQRQQDASLTAAPWLEVYYRSGLEAGSATRGF